MLFSLASCGYSIFSARYFITPELADSVLADPALGELIDEVANTHKVDKSRIYLTGLSMGGYGTWSLGLKHPERFAAIASAKCTNEENYLLQKFTRTVMGTNNIDHCARL